MGGMQGRGRWAWNPSTGGTRFWMTHFLRQHITHQIRHGPHAFANLRLALQTACQTDINISVFIGIDPRGDFHLPFRNHGPRFHRGVNFIARAIQEASVNKGHPRLGRFDAGFEVGACAAFLIHDAELYGILRQAQNALDPGEDFICKCHLIGAMHLGFDHINRAM